MEQKTAIKAITYVIAGSLFQMFGALGDTWVASVVVIGGFIVFYTGLSRLKNNLDPQGRKAVGLLTTAAIIGLIAAFLSLIPIVGILGTLLFALAFAVESYGYFQLKSSTAIGTEGKSGVSLLLTATALAVFNALLDLLPFVGGFVASCVALVILTFMFLGWVKIQDGLMERF